VIAQCSPVYAVKALCLFFEVSRSGYYAWQVRSQQDDQGGPDLVRVKSVYRQSHKTYGYRRVRDELERQGWRWNHKRVLRLMQRLGLRSVARRRRVYKRLEELPNYHRYPNRLRRNFQAQYPNQKWVTDVTYVQTRQGALYLSVIKDLFDGFIVAYQASPSNSVDLVLNTLKQALSSQRVCAGLALHSDQGQQYSSQSYFLLTRRNQIQPSMSRRGNCWDNAVIENFFSHLKAEALRRMDLESFAQAKEAIDDYIHFYNYHRIQLKTKLTPFELRCQSH